MEVTFEQLPKAVSQLYDKLENIERLLLSKNTKTVPEADKLLSIKEAGQLINLAVPTIYGLVGKSGIPVCKKGKRLYFSKTELLDWVKSGRKKTQADIEAETEVFISKKRR
jgi:excisionase family DNA binding protein